MPISLKPPKPYPLFISKINIFLSINKNILTKMDQIYHHASSGPAGTDEISI